MASIQNAVLQENDVAMRSVFQQQKLAQCLQQRRRVQWHESAERRAQQVAQADPLEDLEKIRSEYQQRQRNEHRG